MKYLTLAAALAVIGAAALAPPSVARGDTTNLTISGSPGVDLSDVVTDEDGRPAKDGGGRTEAETKEDASCQKCPAMTVAAAIARALFSTFRDELDLPADRKWARAALAMRIKGEPKSVILTPEEIVEIKKVVGKAYGGIVIAQIYPLLGVKAAPELK